MKKQPAVINDPSSFRDPSGFIFKRNNRVLRQINNSYKENYDLLMRSGLYDALVKSNSLIGHTEVDKSSGTAGAYKIIEPEKIPFISYPYEWCFGELRDAALLTLRVFSTALGHGMTLKDASSYNIQFLSGKPVFIDTLSFERYVEGTPWVGYKQFCEHFLSPLALASQADYRLSALLFRYMDGIPLDLVSKLLPLKAKINPGIVMHILFHAGSQKTNTDASVRKNTTKSFTRLSLMGLIDSLESTVKHLKLPSRQTAWTSYSKEGLSPSYSGVSLRHKVRLVGDYLDYLKPRHIWDIGANTGEFSRIAAGKGITSIAMDFDPMVVDENYSKVKSTGETRIFPLCIDLMNPTSSAGWDASERASIFTRSEPDTILALAIIHHLVCTHNVTFMMLASFFAGHTRSLIIEFIPKEDKQVQSLILGREYMFTDYNEKLFESTFRRYFTIEKKEKLTDSGRILYCMKLKSGNR